MNNKKENFDYWIGRIVMIFFVLFIFSFSKSDSNSHIYSNSLSIEQHINIDNSAILFENINNSNFDNSLLSCEVFGSKSQDVKSGVWVSRLAIKRKIREQELRFINMKPKLLQFYLIQFKTSSDKDYPPIS